MERFTSSLPHILRVPTFSCPSCRRYIPPCALPAVPSLQAGGQDEDAVLSYLLPLCCILPTSMWYPADFPSDYKEPSWTSPAVQWLRLHASYTEGTSSVPGQGTKIPHTCCAVRPKALLWCPVLLPWPLPPCSLHNHTSLFFWPLCIACGILLVSRLRIEPAPLALEAQS